MFPCRGAWTSESVPWLVRRKRIPDSACDNLIDELASLMGSVKAIETKWPAPGAQIAIPKEINVKLGSTLAAFKHVLALGGRVGQAETVRLVTDRYSNSPGDRGDANAPGQ